MDKIIIGTLLGWSPSLVRNQDGKGLDDLCSRWGDINVVGPGPSGKKPTT